jgi:hypothetical protein
MDILKIRLAIKARNMKLENITLGKLSCGLNSHIWQTPKIIKRNISKLPLKVRCVSDIQGLSPNRNWMAEYLVGIS